MAVRSAREAAYETIRSRIITMELKPGDELNDHELAQELGISRTPMREALIMLNIAHMVTIKPQSGTYVAPIDLKLMEMEQFARYTLEKEILNRELEIMGCECLSQIFTGGTFGGKHQDWIVQKLLQFSLNSVYRKVIRIGNEYIVEFF